MTKRLSTALAIVALTGSAAIATATTFTDLMQNSRMTVARIDRVNGRFFCAEHQRWTAVVQADLANVTTGDIVRVDRGEGRAHLTVVRTATDELSSPEN